MEYILPALLWGILWSVVIVLMFDMWSDDDDFYF